MINKYLEISKALRLALPPKLTNQIYLIYFCLILAAFLEMIGLGSIPFFISILLDTNSSFEMWGVNLAEKFKFVFQGDNFLIYFPPNNNNCLFNKKFCNIFDNVIRNKYY